MFPTGGVSAVEKLRWHYHNRHAAALESHRAGQLVVGVTSTTVPFELIAGGGMFPLLLSPPKQSPAREETSSERPASTLPHQVYMEDVFDARIRSLFDFLASRQGDFLQAVIIPRTSEQEHKLFLYLREIQRSREHQNIPHVYLYNLLHTQFAASREYSLGRTGELMRWLESLAGKSVTTDSLQLAVAAGNSARAAVRQLIALREQATPQLSGADAMAILSARFFMNAAQYVELARQALLEIKKSKPLVGPRVLIKGYPLDHDGLHRQIESLGAVVVAEDDPWGSRSASPDFVANRDPLEAIFDHYFSQVTSPRVFPLHLADQWFQDHARLVDGVIFYLPPDDDVRGWDYPRNVAYLQSLNIPYLLVRIDATEIQASAPQRRPASIEAERSIQNFIEQLNSTTSH